MKPTSLVVRAVVSMSFCVLASSARPLLAADRVTAGQYDFTATTDGKAQTFTYCVSAEEAKSVNGDAQAGRAYTEKVGKGACKVTAYDVKGDTVAFTMACGDSVTTSSAQYHGDAFEADTTTTVTVEGKPMVRTAHTVAKRVGACK